MTLGRNIKGYRTLRGMEQKELAPLLGCHSKTISNWERGETEPDASDLIRLSEVLRVPVERLLYGDAAPEPVEVANG